MQSDLIHPGVTGVILAGGRSSRMGSDKALLPYRGGRFIEVIHRQFHSLFDRVMLVTNRPEQYAFLGCPMHPDIFPDMGVLSGLHSGLYHSPTSHIFVAACDMPHLNERLVKALIACRDWADVVIPEGEQGLEPLHAVYGRSCLQAVEAALQSGKRRIISFFPEVTVEMFPSERVRTFDPGFSSFRNINTPEDYFSLRDHDRQRLHEPVAAAR